MMGDPRGELAPANSLRSSVRGPDVALIPSAAGFKGTAGLASWVEGRLLEGEEGSRSIGLTTAGSVSCGGLELGGGGN